MELQAGNLLVFAAGSFIAAVGGARLVTTGVSVLNVALVAAGLFLALTFVNDEQKAAATNRFYRGKEFVLKKMNDRAARGLAIAVIGVLAIAAAVGLTAAQLTPTWVVGAVGLVVVVVWLVNDVPGCYNRR